MKLTEYPWESQNDAFWDTNEMMHFGIQMMHFGIQMMHFGIQMMHFGILFTILEQFLYYRLLESAEVPPV